MFANQTHLLIAASQETQHRLQQEAQQVRLLRQWRRAQQQEQKTMNDHQRAAISMITWRRLWQHLLVGAGLMAALLIRL